MFKNVYRNRKVLITGHTGFKGSWLSMWLIRLGADVSGYSIGIPTEPSHFNELGIQNKINHRIGDIRDYDALKSFCDEVQPEIIFHLAAQALVRESYINPKDTFEVNMLGTLNVLEVIRNTDYVKSCVIITSDKCYENVEWLYGYRENDKLGGSDPYSGSKGAAELVVKSYMHSFFRNGPNIATARAGNVIGGGDWAKDRIIPDIVRSWTNRNKVEIRNPASTRPWQHVLEPLSGYLLLGSELFVSKEMIANESFNFGPDSRVNKTVEALISQMIVSWKEAPGWEDMSNKIETVHHEFNLLKLNCDKANIILNWYPNLDFETTIKFTTDWYLNFYSGRSISIYGYTMSQIDEYMNIARFNKLKWTE